MKKKCAQKSRVNKNSLTKLLLLAVLLVLNSCYENIEGCLDIQASNFDLDADVACENCCSYPELRVRFLHQVKDNLLDTFYTFSLNTPYAFTAEDTFSVENIRFYLSDFRLKLEDGSLLGVEDTITISIPNATDTTQQVVEDNFVFVNRSAPSTSDIGVIRDAVECTGIQFNLGITEPANQADATFFETTHPLFADAESETYFSQDSGYIFNRLDIFRNPIDTTSLAVTTGTNAFLQLIDLDFSFSTTLGFNTTVVLRVDYREWLKNIDFANDSPEDMAVKIQAGVANSFVISEIVSSN